MKQLIWASVMVLCLGAVCGCTGGDQGSKADDDAFRKQLAEAAAKNKTPATPRKGKLSLDDAKKALPKPGDKPAGGNTVGTPN